MNDIAIDTITTAGLKISEEDIKRILIERAKKLAQIVESTDDSSSDLSLILVFSLAKENYGIGIEYIQEVYPFTDFTPLPNSPDFVVGITNIRGIILSIIDIKKFFNLPEKIVSGAHKLIIINNDKFNFCFLADSVEGVRKVFLRKLNPSPATLTGIRSKYLKGVTDDGLVILEIDNLINDKAIK